MTPHIEAQKGDIAKIVLMPGDPLRAEFIAKNFLTDVKKVNGVRNMLMFTGFFNGTRVSICASGMGQPSIGIYSFELFKFYDVETIIRIGSCGSYKKELNLYDIFLATSAYSDSKVFNQLAANIDSHVTFPSNLINEKIRNTAKNMNIEIFEGQVHSSDVFYSQRSLEETIKATNSSVVEMESGALFANAQALNKKAACILTISDNLITKKETSSKERQESFTKMMQLALNSIME